MSDIEVVVDMPAEYSGMVFGQFDEYAKEIERNLKVDLISRDGVVKIIGEKTVYSLLSHNAFRRIKCYPWKLCCP